MDCIAVYHPCLPLEITYCLEIIRVQKDGSTEDTVDLLITNVSDTPLKYVYILYPGDLFGPPTWMRRVVFKSQKILELGGTFGEEKSLRFIANKVMEKRWQRNLKGISGAQKTSSLFDNTYSERSKTGDQLATSTKTPYQNRTLELADPNHDGNTHYRSKSLTTIKIDPQQPLTCVTLRHPTEKRPVAYRGYVFPVDIGVPRELTPQMINILAAGGFSVLKCSFRNQPIVPLSQCKPGEVAKNSRWIRITFRPQKALFGLSQRQFRNLLKMRKMYQGEIRCPVDVINKLEEILSEITDIVAVHAPHTIIDLKNFLIENGFRSPGMFTRICDWRIVLLPHKKFILATEKPFGGIQPGRTLPFDFSHEWNAGCLAFPKHDAFSVIELIYEFLKETGATQNAPKTKIEISGSIGVNHKYTCRILDWLLLEKKAVDSDDPKHNTFYIGNNANNNTVRLFDCSDLYKNQTLDFSIRFLNTRDNYFYIFIILLSFVLTILQC